MPSLVAGLGAAWALLLLYGLRLWHARRRIRRAERAVEPADGEASRPSTS